MSRHKDVIVRKPWGFEYLMYENEDVALWCLHIDQLCETSMHCHPTKTTGLVLLKGEAELGFLADRKTIRAVDKQMIRRGLFHCTRALSDGGAVLLEIETPNDKGDLIRLSDSYGRKANGYEGSHMESPRTKEHIWLEEPSRPNERLNYLLGGVSIDVARLTTWSDFDFLDERAIIIFLRGGLGKAVDGKQRLATVPGDVGRGGILKQVRSGMDFIEPSTTALIIQHES